MSVLNKFSLLFYRQMETGSEIHEQVQLLSSITGYDEDDIWLSLNRIHVAIPVDMLSIVKEVVHRAQRGTLKNFIESEPDS